MKNGQLSNFRHKVAETDFYRTFPQVVRKITMSRNNISHLEHGYTVAKNIGFKKWEKQCGFSSRNIQLVKELLEDEGR